MIDSNGTFTPSALIPFCGYQTHLLGQTRPSHPFTICSQFKPTLMYGQLCYSFRLNSNLTKAGIKHGLLLLLDPGHSEHSQSPESNYIQGHRVSSLNLEHMTTSDSSARLVVHTLESLADYRAGRYGLSGLKKMTGTNSFMELPIGNKKCQTETYEKCHSRRYIEEVQKQCGCIPWSLNSLTDVKVQYFLKTWARAILHALL